MTSEWRIPSGFVTAVLMYIIVSAFTGVWFVASLSSRVSSLEDDRTTNKTNTELLHTIDTRTQVMQAILQQDGNQHANSVPPVSQSPRAK